MTPCEVEQELNDAWYYQEEEDEREKQEEQEKLDLAERRERERIDKINAVNNEYGVRPVAGGSTVNPYIDSNKSFHWYDWNWTIYFVSCMTMIFSYLITIFVLSLLGTPHALNSPQANETATSVAFWTFILTFAYAKIRKKTLSGQTI